MIDQREILSKEEINDWQELAKLSEAAEQFAMVSPRALRSLCQMALGFLEEREKYILSIEPDAERDAERDAEMEVKGCKFP